MEPIWIERLESRGEELIRELLGAHLANLSGRDSSAPDRAIFDRYGELADPGTFGALREQLGEAPDRAEQRRLSRLVELVGTSLERRASAEVAARRLAAEASISVEVAGRAVAYRALPVEIQSTRDPREREALQRAMCVTAIDLGRLHAEELGLARDAAGRAGWDDYVAWRSMLARHDVDEVALHARQLLDETEAMGREAIASLLSGRIERRAEGLGLHDLWRALRAVDLDDLLHAGEQHRVDAMLSSIGLDPVAGGRIVRDLEDRPRKSSRAFCVPLRVPQEVHLVLRPAGGLPEWRGLLHELGHALHAAYTDPARPFHERRLGDVSVSEGYAVLLDHLLTSRVFGQRVLCLAEDKARTLARVAAAAALVTTRRHAAKLLFEVALHRGRVKAGEGYVELMREATGLEHPGELALVDVDPEIYVARYVRAWMFEGVAHAALRERFDDDWFRNPRAGAYLRGLFAQGQARDLDELCEEELGARLEPGPVVRRFEDVL